jgi:hypothetical protein
VAEMNDLFLLERRTPGRGMCISDSYCINSGRQVAFEWAVPYTSPRAGFELTSFHIIRSNGRSKI